MTDIKSRVWPLQCVVLSDERAGLSFVMCPCLCQFYTYVYISLYVHIQGLHILMYNIYMASVSPGFVQQIMPYLNLLYATTAA
jgi:hypothetical protein